MIDLNDVPAPAEAWDEDDTSHLNALLTDRIEDLATALFGPNDRHRSSAMEWRWKEPSSLSVAISGDRKGSWNWHRPGVGGGPLALIHQQVGNWTEAYRYARDFLGEGVLAAPAPQRQTGAKAKRHATESSRYDGDCKLILSKCVPAAGTLVEAYWEARRVPMPACSDLLFCADITDHQNRIGRPGMIAVVRRPDGKSTGGLHRTFLNSDGTKTKKMLGNVKGGAVQFAPIGDDGILGLGEGLETCGAAMAIFGVPVWAGLSTSGMTSLPLGEIAGLRRIIIFADAGAAGEKAAQQVAENADAAGVEWEIIRPIHGDDFAHDLTRGATAADYAAPSSKPVCALQPYYPGSFDDRAQALAKMDSAIMDWCHRAANIARARREAASMRAEAHAVMVGQSGGEHWLDLNGLSASARAASSRRINRTVARRYGLRSLHDTVRLQMAAPAGAGKTRAICQAAGAGVYDGVTVWILEPTADMARQTVADIQAAGGEARYVFGRMSEGACERPAVVRKVQECGLNVREHCCDNGKKQCPHLAECAYMRQVAELKQASSGIFVMAHQYLIANCPAPSPDIVIVDESHWRMMVGSVEFSPDRITTETAWRDLSAALEYRAVAGSVAAALPRPDLLTALRERGIAAPTDLEPAFAHLRAIREEKTADITPDTPDADAESRLAVYEQSEAENLLTMYRAVGREIELPRGLCHGVEFSPNHPVKVNGKAERQARVLVHYRRRLMNVAATTPVLLIDASADLEVNRLIWGDDLQAINVRIERNARVYQVRGKEFSNQSLSGKRKGGADLRASDAEKLRKEVADFANSLAGKTLVVCNAKIEELLAPLLGENVAIGHFGAMRGRNDWADFDNVVMVGREQPPSYVPERQARALWAIAIEPLMFIGEREPNGHAYHQTRGRRMANGTVEAEEVFVLPDPRCQRLLEMCREREGEQSIDRLRLIHNAHPKNVYVLNNLVMDVTVTATHRWSEMMVGGSPVERAFAAVEHALPLVATWLVEQGIYQSERTAKRAIGEITKSANSQILSIWRLALFRISQQRAWSHAIVKPSSAENDAVNELADLMGAVVKEFKWALAAHGVLPEPAYDPEGAWCDLSTDRLFHVGPPRPSKPVTRMFGDDLVEPGAWFQRTTAMVLTVMTAPELTIHRPYFRPGKFIDLNQIEPMAEAA